MGARSLRDEGSQKVTVGAGIPKPLSLWERLREGGAAGAGARGGLTLANFVEGKNAAR